MEPNYPYQSTRPEGQSLISKKWVVLGFVSVTLIILLYIGLAFCFVRVSVSGDASGTASVSLKDFTDSPTRATKTLGTVTIGKNRLFFVRRGTYEFSATTSNAGSSLTSTLKPFQINKLSIEVKQQRDVKKIGTEGLGCSTLVDDVLYSYDCGSESSVFKHEPLKNGVFSQKSAVDSGRKKKIARNYQNGLLIMDELEGADGNIQNVRYLDLTRNQSTVVEVPADFYDNTPAGTQTVGNIIVDQSYETGAFGVVLYDNSILIYKNTADKNPRQVKLDFSSTGLRSNELAKQYRLYKEALFVFASREDTSEDSETEEELSKNYKQGYATEYSLTGPEPKITREVVIPKDVTGGSGTLFGDNKFVIQTKSGLRVFNVEDKKLGKELLRTPSQNYIVAQNNQTLLIGSDQLIHSFDPPYTQMHLVFASPVFSFSSFSLTQKDILVDAITQSNDRISKSQIYSLNMKQVGDSNSFEKKLPYSRKDLPIADMDFLGRLIVIRPVLETISYAEGPEYEQEEFDTRTRQIRDALRKDGITESNATIIFVP